MITTMRANILAAMLFGVLASTLAAQDADDRQRGRERRGPGRLLDSIPDSLELNDKQRAEFDEILAAHRERIRE